MDYYRNLKLQLEAVTLLVATFSAQAGTLMAALTKPGTCTGTRASGTAPEAQHVVGGGENEEPFPSLPEPSQLPQPWALERPPCTLGQGGGHEASPRACPRGEGEQRQSVVPILGFGTLLSLFGGLVFRGSWPCLCSSLREPSLPPGF